VISDAHALSTIETLERAGCKIDAILPSGRHRYFSTWCRHDKHGPCQTNRHIKAWADDGTPVELYDTPREPSQCKTCAAPCVCSCHQGGVS